MEELIVVNMINLNEVGSEIHDGHHLLQRLLAQYDNKALQSVKRDYKGYMQKANTIQN